MTEIIFIYFCRQNCLKNLMLILLTKPVFLCVLQVFIRILFIYVVGRGVASGKFRGAKQQINTGNTKFAKLIAVYFKKGGPELRCSPLDTSLAIRQGFARFADSGCKK